MFFWRFSSKPTGQIYDWLLQNKEEILAGTATYMDTPVNDSTYFYEYRHVFSCGMVTLTMPSPHQLPTSANGYLRTTRWKYVMGNLLMGWWCFPWGPPFTIHALAINLGGGRKRTAGSLLQSIEWGWDAPADASAGSFRKEILEVSEVAAAEIQSRRSVGGFAEDMAVRISPTKSADSEVEIAFDYPVSDGRDWVDESQGLMLLVDVNHERQLAGRILDYRDGVFIARRE